MTPTLLDDVKAYKKIDEYYNSDDSLSDKIVTIPNIISAVRILLIPVFAVLVGFHQDIAAVIVFCITAASDYFDGYFARKLKQVTKIGRLLDPIADRLLIFITLIMLVVREVVPLWLFIAIFLREALLFVLYAVIILKGKKPPAVTFAGKVATAMLLFALPLTLLGVSMCSVNYCKDLGVGISHTVLTITTVANVFMYAGIVLYWIVGVYYCAKGVLLLRGRKANNRKNSDVVSEVKEK